MPSVAVAPRSLAPNHFFTAALWLRARSDTFPFFAYRIEYQSLTTLLPSIQPTCTAPLNAQHCVYHPPFVFTFHADTFSSSAPVPVCTLRLDSCGGWNATSVAFAWRIFLQPNQSTTDDDSDEASRLSRYYSSYLLFILVICIRYLCWIPIAQPSWRLLTFSRQRLTCGRRSSPSSPPSAPSSAHTLSCPFSPGSPTKIGRAHV